MERPGKLLLLPRVQFLITLNCNVGRQRSRHKRKDWTAETVPTLSLFSQFLLSGEEWKKTSVLFPVHTFLLQVLLVRFPYNHHILITNFTLCTVWSDRDRKTHCHRWAIVIASQAMADRQAFPVSVSVSVGDWQMLEQQRGWADFHSYNGALLFFCLC